MFLIEIKDLRVLSLNGGRAETVQQSSAGWDHITQSLVHFAFMLLDRKSGVVGLSAQRVCAARPSVERQRLN